ncbi:hypothetical protein FOA43_003095 [Brettanomyces nanus]|uniref:Homeobox domain-containing protein n=1 Tax=Eeniella nana TaxID=13502 RepID=A0A875S5W6_EENNA|nr:uncharacterized protein FOA43_003095 [Brettanomyces nanus]QPG75735.1 hypothetical protein FOA43_003095 [Brettanomyces nanus]
MGNRDRNTRKRVLKGLQKTKFYCQICERQCLDENGFKCHIQSESHIRKLGTKMSDAGHNSKRLVDEYSEEFLKSFLGLLRRMHGEKMVGANKFYQEYIQDKDHVHMNSTRWNNLTSLVMYLGESGKCKVKVTDEELDDSDLEKFSIAYRDEKGDSIGKRKEREKQQLIKNDKEVSDNLLRDQIERGKKRRIERTESKDEEQKTPNKKKQQQQEQQLQASGSAFVSRSRSDPSPRPSTRLPSIASIFSTKKASNSAEAKSAEANSADNTVCAVPSSSTPKTTSLGSITLPSIDHLTSSPSYARSHSYPSLPLPSSTPRTESSEDLSSKSFIPVTPVSRNILLPPSHYGSTAAFAYAPQSSTPISYGTLPAPPIFMMPVQPLSFVYRRSDKTSPSTPARSAGSNGASTSWLAATPLKTPMKRKRTPSKAEKKYAFISHNQTTFLSCEPSIDNARLARRKRRRTSPTELAVLLAEFKKGSTPNRARRNEIASKVDMTEKAVQIWFQNRRQALRKSKIIKTVVVEVPKKDELDENILNNGSYEGSVDDGNVTMSDSARTSPEASPVKSEPSNSSFSISADTSSSSVVVPPPKVTFTSLETRTATSRDGKLPPTGLFVTPSKLKSDTNKRNVLTSPSVSHNENHKHNPLTFRFRTTDFMMMNPSQPGGRRQKPTMKLKLSKSNSNSRIALQDKTNIANNRTRQTLQTAKPARSPVASSNSQTASTN